MQTKEEEEAMEQQQQQQKQQQQQQQQQQQHHQQKKHIPKRCKRKYITLHQKVEMCLTAERVIKVEQSISLRGFCREHDLQPSQLRRWMKKVDEMKAELDTPRKRTRNRKKKNSDTENDNEDETTKVDDEIHDEVQERKVEETKMEETKIEETKIEETKIEETKIEETKMEDCLHENEVDDKTKQSRAINIDKNKKKIKVEQNTPKESNNNSNNHSNNNSNNHKKNNINDDTDEKKKIKGLIFTEGKVTISLAPGEDTALFYNPVQVQNRDLSILMITLYNERRAVRHAKNIYYQQLKQEVKEKVEESRPASVMQVLEQIKEKVKQYESTLSGRKLVAEAVQTANEAAAAATATTPSFPGLTILDALAASGLRSMRYWKEIPGIEHVCINDLDPVAVERALANLVSNDLEHVRVTPSSSTTTTRTTRKQERTAAQEEELISISEQKISAAATTAAAAAVEPQSEAMSSNSHRRPRGILIPEGDALDEMYARRQRNVPRPDQPPPFHVIDLDPNGSAAPFLDAAIQAVDGGCSGGGGFLCVTCTDMAALGGSHPETCFGRYGGSMPLQRAQYLQEFSVRIMLHSIATTAARYGRTMKPILSIGTDFYVRVFVEINIDEAGVNQLSLQTGYVFQSTNCPSFHIVRAGQIGGSEGSVYQAGRLSPENLSVMCEETGAGWNMGGPLWLGPMHDPDVITAALQRLKEEDQNTQDVALPPAPDLNWIATKDRLRGLLEICLEETTLEDAPLYYDLLALAKTIRCMTPPIDQFKAGIVNAGYRVSGYHKNPNALKTNAPNHAMWDIVRNWVIKHPSRNIPIRGSAAEKILSVAPKIDVDFDTEEMRLQKRKRARLTGVGQNLQQPFPRARALGKRKPDEAVLVFNEEEGEGTGEEGEGTGEDEEEGAEEDDLGAAFGL